MPQKTAAIVAIGDELLSGRTRDANIAWLAGWLAARGIALKEARIVADVESAIVEALNALRARHDYVFTSGGIGPTHDDITADAVAAAFGVPCAEHPEAAALIRAWYAARGQEATPARMRMARAPVGAGLIDNPVSGAPGLRMENVFVLAGVPSIFRAMLDALEPALERGPLLHTRAVTARTLPESALADALRTIVAAHPGVSLGSYPIDSDRGGVSVVARSDNPEASEAVISRVAEAMRALGAAPVFEDSKDAC